MYIISHTDLNPLITCLLEKNVQGLPIFKSALYAESARIMEMSDCSKRWRASKGNHIPREPISPEHSEDLESFITPRGIRNRDFHTEQEVCGFDTKEQRVILRYCAHLWEGQADRDLSMTKEEENKRPAITGT